nr:dipeptide/oligopeptide/nickel ABC transporter permease/ATP-binding protein [Jiangella sp. DSM 45060]
MTTTTSTTQQPTDPTSPKTTPHAASQAGGDSPRSARRAWRSALSRPLAVMSLAYLVLLVVAAIAAPAVAPFDPADLDLDSVLAGPSAEHLLGTDALGRDVLSRLIYGGRISLLNAAIAAVTFLVVGLVGGLAAGFYRGWVDRAISGVVDIMIAIPGLIILLVVLAVFGGNMTVAMVALGVLTAPGFARVMRAVTLAVRAEPYIAAAQVSGLPNRRIIVHHVIPRVTGPILVQFSLFCGAALLVDAGLAYLGFGAQPPTPTWGGMIVEASTVMQQQPWLLVPAGATLGLATLAFALLGDAVRDATEERTGRTAFRSRRAHAVANRARVSSPAGDEPAPTALLRLRHVSIALPVNGALTTVVDDVNLDVEAGETVGLVGESGCGKSITASAVLGLLPAGAQITTGQIWFDGTDLTSAQPRTIQKLRGSRIAMIAQDPISSLDPVFSVGQQVSELVRRHHGGSRAAARAHTLELLASVSLRDPDRVARRYPHELSGGMAQRVALAMALAGDPDLLIADEPTTALDVTVQAEILELLQRLQRERGMAVLLITHDWGVVGTACHRANVMYAGQVVETCDVASMFRSPSHPYTVGLLQSTPHQATPLEHLRAVPGAVPAPGAWPAGCHFAPRCALAAADCGAAPIAMAEAAPKHLTRCLHHDQIARLEAP